MSNQEQEQAQVLPFEAEGIEAIPEPLRGYYEQNDSGTWRLRLDRRVVPEERYQAVTRESITRRKALTEAEAARAALEQQLQELQSKLPDSEAIQKRIEAARKPLEDQLRQLTERLNQYRVDTVRSQLRDALARAGVLPDALDPLVDHAYSRVRMGDGDAVEILDADRRSPMVGRAADGSATLDDLAAEMAARYPALVRSDRTGGGGRPPAAAGGSRAGNNPPDDPRAKAEYYARLAASKRGG